MSYVTVPLEIISAISIECWRLSKSVKAGTVEDYSTRKIAEQLNAIGLTIVDMAGKQYDPGLAPEVVDIILDPSIPPGQSIISETVAPLVLMNGAVTRPGQIILRSGPPIEE